MKVRMKVSMSGTRNGQPWPARGEMLECSDAEGADLVAANLAEQVESAKKAAKVETATDDRPVETTKGLTTERGPRGGGSRTSGRS